MGLDTTLARYRVTIPLALAILGPVTIGFTLGTLGLAGTNTVSAISTLIVWTVLLWAVGAAGWELYAGYKRRSNPPESNQANPAAD